MDSGSSINVIKADLIDPKHPREECNKEFVMGNDLHISKALTKLRFQEVDHIFYIVPNNFPLPEDGIIGIPFMHSYHFNLSNHKLKLNEKEYELIDDGIYVPKNSVRLIEIETQREKGQVIIQDNPFIPDSIYCVSNHRFKVPIANETQETLKINTEDVKYNYITIKSGEDRINYITTRELNDRLKLLRENTRLSHLEEEHKVGIEKIVQTYHDIFSLTGDPLPCTKLASHKIALKDETPLNIKSYRPPEFHKSEISRQVQDMLTKKVIRHSDSPYNAPLWVVPKKTDASGKKKWRIVIDFRKLNEKTDHDAYPLPIIDDILDHLGKAKFFSAFDLSSGFHQIPMESDSRKYTAFSTPEGHFEYERMPFGLKNAPATFQRMMDTALRGLIGKICFVYLDDIVIFGSTIQEHHQNLVTLFERLRQTGLKLQPDKCEYLRPELEYLGHVITAEGVKPNSKKIEAVLNFKKPSNPTDVQAFLGLSGYYRKFIKNFSTRAKPLTELTKKNQPFYWTEACEKAFQDLKNCLCSSPVLRYPNYSKEFTLTTDASNVGLGGILSQDGHPCCYISRTLNKPEINYSTTEKELLAIVWSVKRLRQFLLGRKFKIQTDHQALKWLFSVKDPSSRLLRWRLRLEEYDYEIEYVKGKDNKAADALSRVLPVQDFETEKKNAY